MSKTDSHNVKNNGGINDFPFDIIYAYIINYIWYNCNEESTR